MIFEEAPRHGSNHAALLPAGDALAWPGSGTLAQLPVLQRLELGWSACVRDPNALVEGSLVLAGGSEAWACWEAP